MSRLIHTAAVALVLACVSATPALGQVFTGRIDLQVTDSTGAVLPGVSVELTGAQTATAVTDEQGQARFLNLQPGPYEVRATLSGFRDFRAQNVQVVAGGSVPLRVTLAVSGVAEQVEVIGETPTVDPKRTHLATNVTLDELQNIPSSRDPWVVLQTVPGIVVDRVNVGGAESGQQSNFIGRGASRSEATWNLDGIPITDMSATGATSTYYDFDMFQEMTLTTGGADVKIATPGVGINFVMKSGSNTPHGSGRVYFATEGLQSDNVPSDLRGRLIGPSGKGNRTDQNADYGFEMGGPLMRDKWWAWGSISRNDVRLLTLNDVLDRTILKNYGFKTQAQLTPNIRPSFTYFLGDKLKFGRGASPTHPDETTWNQNGPSHVFKGQSDFTLRNNLFLQANYAFFQNEFTLAPRGGMDKDVFIDDEGVWHNSYVFYTTKRPQHSLAADANLFRGDHEFKFGFMYRRYAVESQSIWPGSRTVTTHLGYPDMAVTAYRDWFSNLLGRYTNAYVSDTISRDRLTLNLGVRWDLQKSNAKEVSVPGVPGFENLLPALNAPAVEEGFTYNTLSPRLGVTYAIGEARRTQVRASYARFASQLGAGDAFVVSPVQPYAYVYYLAVDRNGNRVADQTEILFNLGLQAYNAFDPDDPTKLESVNVIGDDTSAPLTDELLGGIDHEVFANFSVSGTFSYRYIHNLRWSPRIGVRRDDYRQTGTVTDTLPDGTSVSVPFFALNTPVAGREYINREGYHQRYWGFEVNAIKRMSNRWMARLGFSTNDHREYFDDPSESIEDPTPANRDPGSGVVGPLVDGGWVFSRTSGSGKSEIYMVLPRYQFIANGMVEGPWDVNFGANLVVRQGFGMPFFRSSVPTQDPVTSRKRVLLIQDIDENRLPAVTSLDVRLEKAFALRRANLIFDFDIFNLTNESTILGRQYDRRLTGATGFNEILEIMNPRIVRLGLRVTF
jgi:hypothetical protein